MALPKAITVKLPLRLNGRHILKKRDSSQVTTHR